MNKKMNAWRNIGLFFIVLLSVIDAILAFYGYSQWNALKIENKNFIENKIGPMKTELREQMQKNNGIIIDLMQE